MMRTWRRLCVLLTTALVAGSAWTCAAQAASVIDVNRTLPIAGSGTLLVDRLHHHLLVTAVRGASTEQQGLLVLNPDGSTVTDVLPPASVADVSIAPDGRSAWLTAGTQDGLTLDRVDLGTFVVTQVHVFYPDEDAIGLAVVGNRYVAVGLAEHDSTAVDVFDVKTGVAVGGLYIPPGPQGGVWLRAIPETNDFVTMTGLGTATVYDATSGTPVIVGGPKLLPGCAHVTDIVVASDGHSMVPICADQPATVPLTQYLLGDLAVSTTYPLPFEPLPSYDGTAHLSAAAFSSDGSFLAVGDNEPGRNLVLLRRSGAHWQGYAAKSFGPNQATADRGVQLSDDGTVAYVLVDTLNADGGVTGVTLHTVAASPTPIARPTSKLTVTAPAVAPVGTSVAISGVLRFSDNSSPWLAAGRQITISRTLNGQLATVTETLDAAGSFRFVNTPTSAGAASYTVAFAGDQLHTGTTATVTVSVAPGLVH